MEVFANKLLLGSNRDIYLPATLGFLNDKNNNDDIFLNIANITLYSSRSYNIDTTMRKFSLRSL